MKSLDSVSSPKWQYHRGKWRREKETREIRPSSRYKRLLIKIGIKESPTRTYYEYKDSLEEGDKATGAYPFGADWVVLRPKK